MPEKDDRTAILTQALTVSADAYKENSRVMGLLDDKSQKTATMASIFLAAGFAFLRKDSLRDFVSFIGIAGLILLAISIGLLLASLVSSGLVLWARKLKMPPDPRKIWLAGVFLLSKPGGPTGEDRENYIRDQVQSWNRAISLQEKVITDKSLRLLVAQWLLISAIGVIAILLVISLLGTGAPQQNPNRDYQLIPVESIRESTISLTGGISDG